ncbi:MAG: hypothetical protein L0206_11020, partial [Actinobacteria bacterium]|nr:hypothetical protein [Actinomycetota bacterium]
LPVYRDGYSQNLDDPLSAPEIVLCVNTRAGTRSATGTDTFASITDADELANFTSAVSIAGEIWECAPACRVRTGVGPYRAVDDIDKEDGINVMTLLGGAYTKGGSTFFDTRRDGGIWLEYVEHDVTLRRNLVSTTAGASIKSAIAVMVHETGHGLGLNHSLLGGKVVEAVTGATSKGAFMSYGRNNLTDGNVEDGNCANDLSIDDIAIIAELYPSHELRRARTCGTLRGRVVLNDDGSDPLYGANVVVIDRATGQAVMHGLTGYRFKSSPSRRGEFEIYGVPPGSYDVLVAPYDDLDVGSSIPEIAYRSDDDGSPDARPEFDVGFARAFVRDVAVVAGRICDLGLVVAGSDRAFAAPDANEVSIAIPRSSAYTSYRVEITDFFTFSHDSGWLGNVAAYRTVVPDGHPIVRISGRTSSGAVTTLQNWTERDFRAVAATLSWPRAFASHQGIVLEYREYRVTLSQGATTFLDALAVDGDSLRTMLVPGTYVYRVDGKTPGGSLVMLKLATLTVP